MRDQKDSLWFTHDHDAANDPKMIALINEYGMEGYGRFWRLIEILRGQREYKLDITQKFSYSSLADALKSTKSEVEKFIKSLIEYYELLHTDNKFIWSPSLIIRMQFWDTKKEIYAERGRKGAIRTNEIKKRKREKVKKNFTLYRRLSDTLPTLKRDELFKKIITYYKPPLVILKNNIQSTIKNGTSVKLFRLSDAQAGKKVGIYKQINKQINTSSNDDDIGRENNHNSGFGEKTELYYENNEIDHYRGNWHLQTNIENCKMYFVSDSYFFRNKETAVKLLFPKSPPASEEEMLESLNHYLDKFNNYLLEIGQPQRSMQGNEGYPKHFTNWLPYQLNSELKSKSKISKPTEHEQPIKQLTPKDLEKYKPKPRTKNL